MTKYSYIIESFKSKTKKGTIDWKNTALRMSERLDRINKQEMQEGHKAKEERDKLTLPEFIENFEKNHTPEEQREFQTMFCDLAKTMPKKYSNQYTDQIKYEIIENICDKNETDLEGLSDRIKHIISIISEDHSMGRSMEQDLIEGIPPKYNQNQIKRILK